MSSELRFAPPPSPCCCGPPNMQGYARLGPNAALILKDRLIFTKRWSRLFVSQEASPQCEALSEKARTYIAVHTSLQGLVDFILYLIFSPAMVQSDFVSHLKCYAFGSPSAWLHETRPSVRVAGVDSGTVHSERVSKMIGSTTKFYIHLHS